MVPSRDSSTTPAASTPPTSESSRRTRLGALATLASLKLTPEYSTLTRMSSLLVDESATSRTPHSSFPSSSLTTKAFIDPEYAMTSSRSSNQYDSKGEPNLLERSSHLGSVAKEEGQNHCPVARWA